MDRDKFLKKILRAISYEQRVKQGYYYDQYKIKHINTLAHRRKLYPSGVKDCLGRRMNNFKPF